MKLLYEQLNKITEEMFFRGNFSITQNDLLNIILQYEKHKEQLIKDKPLVLPTDDHIHKEALKVAEIENESVHGVAWYYFEKGAKWIKSDVEKQTTNE